jgi:hypothetical protein
MHSPQPPPKIDPPSLIRILQTQKTSLACPALIITAITIIIMAVPSHCNHSFNLLKSESTLIQWVCAICHSGPHWHIFECKYCKLKTCRPCAAKA